ncbi:MAG: uroporphyrinogen-III synthase [Roseovarius sp.]|nr:uroporphyrinogen-III synthase [Roseovarius sp.]MCY4207214.1 uroporphyrinogen-III synthase [Roseovarius sp.]MCY4290354.1 uroporphyrinogen-III synthase [Roseovarius sp.]MCY4316847.1 uroporphyrinogen-III synthase [Roseovarius sp.]
MTPGILIIRPRKQALALKDAILGRLGEDVRVCISPMIRIRHLAADLALDGIKTLAFTSRHAVAAFSKLTSRRDFVCHAVGEATAAEASDEGFDPIAGNGGGLALARQIIRDGAPAPCLYLHGRHISHNVADSLNEAGLKAISATVYTQEASPLSPSARAMLAAEAPVVLPLYSARSARLFFADAKIDAPLFVAAISDKVSREVPLGATFRISVASASANKAMLDEIELMYGISIYP